MDRFSVHPKQRWTTYTVTQMTDVIDNGIFKVSDVGDDTVDSFEMERKLSKTDSKVEIKFKLDTNGTMTHTYDKFQIMLIGETQSNYIMLKVSDFNDSDYYTTEILFTASDAGSGKNKTMSGDERIYDNEWYILKISYDLFESETKFRLSFMNGTKVFDYYWYELRTEDWTPSLFTEMKTGLTIRGWCRTGGQQIIYRIDYINAPFKERDWKQTIDGSASDADWLSESPLGVLVQDDLSAEDSEWQIVVPELDSVSGTMFHGGGFFDSGDSSYFSVVLYGMDGDDGDMHKVAEVRLNKQYSGPSGVNFSLLDGNGNVEDEYTHGTIAYTPKTEFSISLVEDRSIVEISGRCWQDHADEDAFGDVYASIDVSDHVDDPSSEFVVRTYYYSNFDYDFEFVMKFEEFGWLERNIFEDIGRGLGLELLFLLAGIFPALFRFLASIFKVVGDAIILAIEALEPFFSVIRDAVKDLEEFLTAIGTAIGEIADDIWASIGDALDFIIDAIEAILDELILIIGDILNEVFIVLGTLISVIVEFIADIIFWIWAELGLPDVLAIIDLFLTPVFTIVTGFPAFIIDFSTLLTLFVMLILGFYWFWLIFLAFAEKGFNVFAGFGEMVNRLFTFYNFSFLGIGPVPFPIALIFIPFTYFMVIPSGSVFAIW